MTGIITRAELLVDAILATPPTDNTQLLHVATSLEQDAARMAAFSEMWRAQGRRLRDFVGTRQTRMDGTPDQIAALPVGPKTEGEAS